VELMPRSERQGRGGWGLDLASRGLTVLTGQDRYQSTGRRRPRVGLSGAWRLVIRIGAPLALLGLAYLYWVWPNDLVPDRLPYGRADDIAVAFVNMLAAVRIAAGRRLGGEAGETATGDLPGDAGRGRSDKPRGARELDAIAAVLAAHGPPIVVYNASHSGSRLLTRMLSGMGVYMGANLNASEDSIDIAELVEHIVLEHAPDFSGLFDVGDPMLGELATSAVTAHLSGRPPGARWGWKLCETGHALPVIARLFPDALFVHLIRDGRDVAFSNFVAPKHPYWRKIHFNSAKIRSWRGLGMSQRAYRAHAPLFNAARWANSVSLGRGHGAMLGERYHEVRYEALVTEPARIARELAAHLQLPALDSFGAGLEIDVSRVGKWRAENPADLAEVCQLIGPTLREFGYPSET
jgi:sulfotransferase family protein/uncharacterized protein DUF1232